MHLPISIVAPEFIATITQFQLHIESVVHNQYTITVHSYIHVILMLYIIMNCISHNSQTIRVPKILR